jgi:hypothetical protein
MAPVVGKHRVYSYCRFQRYSPQKRRTRRDNWTLAVVTILTIVVLIHGIPCPAKVLLSVPEQDLFAAHPRRYCPFYDSFALVYRMLSHISVFHYLFAMLFLYNCHSLYSIGIIDPFVGKPLLLSHSWSSSSPQHWQGCYEVLQVRRGFRHLR